MTSAVARRWPRQRWASWVSVALALALSAASYVFFISAGRVTRLPDHSQYYALLADGFLKGHLHLGVAPPPELLRVANPFDEAYSKLWLYDATLYRGHYYLYWGPVPAIVAALLKLVAGRSLEIGDDQLVLAFVLGRLLVGGLLFAFSLKWLFPDLRRWMIAPPLLIFGLANPYPFGLGRPAVYEAAIESAQFFLLVGIFAGLVAMHVGGRGRPQRIELVLLFLAGSAWGTALACRISLLFAIVGVTLATALVCAARSGRAHDAIAARVASVGVPVLLSGFLLAWYNHARFGSWTEFGTSYQLDPVHLNFGAARFLPNLHAYLLRRFHVTCTFPFVDAPAPAIDLVPSWVDMRKAGYFPLEPEVGLLFGAPCVVFGVIAIYLGGRLAGRALRRGGESVSASEWPYLWLTAACVVIVVLAPVPALGMPASTMRYLADFSSAALLLAALGFWSIGPRLRVSPAARRVLWSAASVLGAYTILVGILLGFQGGYYGSFQRFNPALHGWLVQHFSLCASSR